MSTLHHLKCAANSHPKKHTLFLILLTTTIILPFHSAVPEDRKFGVQLVKKCSKRPVVNVNSKTNIKY